MKIVKRLFLFLFVLIVLLVGAAVAIPYFFKDKIVAVVKEEVNERVNATVDFKDVNLSLFRSFPDLTLGLEGFSVVGKDDFADVTLAAGKSFDLTLDLMSVIKSSSQPIEIKKVSLIEPLVNVYVLKNGKANYNIALPAKEETSNSTQSSAMQINLSAYSIENGTLVYDDATMPVRVEAKGLNHSGSGDFTLDVFDLTTQTNIDALSINYDNVSYLNAANTALNMTLNANMKAQKFTLKENDLTLNSLNLKLDGFVEMPNDKDIAMDLTFEAPQNVFKNLLSIIPNAYIKDYKDVKADGNFTLNGFAKGVYNENSYPAFRINTSISNADVQYPDLPLGISDINTKIEVNSPSADLNRMTVDIPNFALKIGNNPVQGYFKLKTPISDPDMDMKLDGVIDLAELNKAYPIEGMEDMTGIITSDVVVKTKLSTIEKEDYANVNMSGALKVQDLIYAAKDMPKVKVKNAEANFTPQRVVIPTFVVQTGDKSDLSGSAEIDNILAYFSPEKTMKGKVNINSSYFNADEWMSSSEMETTPEAAPVASTTNVNSEVFDRYDFDFSAKMDKIDYSSYDLKNIKGSGNFTPNQLTINDYAMNIGDSDFSAKGKVTNVMNYLYKNEKLGGQINLSSNYFNLNPFMEEKPNAAKAVAVKETEIKTEDLEPFIVPENIEMAINANMNEVIYTNMNIKNIRGVLSVKDQAVTMKDVVGNTLGGIVKLSGGYGTNNPEKPSFDLNTEIENMDFQEAFTTLNTFEKIAPIGKFIKGNFNTKLSLNGILGKDMMPDLSTLNLDGFLQTLNGLLIGFEPLQEVGNALNIGALKTLEIKNTKNWLEVKDGKFEVKEFDQKFQDIDMKIGGWHMITNEGMDYNIVAKVPRARLGELNNIAGKGLDWLSGEASKLGININAGEFVNLGINVTGSMKKPKVKVKLLGTEGDGKSLQDAAKDKVQEELDKKKAELKDKADEEAEKLKQEALKKAEEEADKLRKKAEEELKKRLEKEAAEEANEALKKVEENLGEEAKDALDNLKDKLPWGKKKKNDGNK